MKRRILIPACVLAAALLAGCNKDENIQGLTDISTTTFQAFTESGGTKTFLENGGSETESHSVLWVPGDAIGIASASDFSRYEYKGDGQTDFAEFEGDPVHGDYFYAVYPYSEKAALSGDMLSLELPSVQEYTPLSFAPGVFPMVARSESTVLEFKNLCGLLKINLTGTETISSITFRSSGQGVSGPATVSMDYESVPELVMSDGAGMSVTLDCGEGVALNGTVPMPFYIVLPAGTYDDFSIVVTSADGGVMTKSNSGLVINRSMVRPTSDVEFVPDGTGYDGDREALIAFYNATDGPNWKDDTNWCSDQPLDTWHGVITDSEGRVTEIGLNNNNLSGEAGNTLAPLTALTYLDLYSNNISTLDVSANTALTILYCSDNSLGTLDLSDIPGLEVLLCSGNRLTSLDIRNNEGLASIEVGRQTDADGNYVDMYLYVTEAQLELWNNSWSGNALNEYVVVSTRKDYFDISPRSFDVPAGGGEIAVTVSTDQDYTVGIADPEWITLVSGEGVKEGRVVFKVAANTVPSERTGMIQFCAGSNCYNVEVRQEAETQDVDEELFNKTFFHRSLGMRFTADWCGYCPNMAAAFSTVQEQLPDKFEVVNLHGSGSGLYFSSTGALESQYGISGYPSGIVDGRTDIPNFTEQSAIVSLVTSTISETESTYPTVSGISFNSSISGQTLTADVTLYLKKADNYKVTVVVLEDGIVGYQANYYGDTYYDYVHDGVARIAMSDITGDSFTTSSDNQTRTFSYSAEIPADCVKDNLRVLVYVQRAFGSQPVISSGNYGGYYVDNCASAKAGTSLDLVTVEDMEDIGGGNEDFGNDGRHEW
ncbi:MAG TPA: Omp28-related outer membrane protein [Candidatus Coprenecus merdigallinarum]|nr:Omp28-related outer membrane protein [Candidatus Coprenecus merdigallinarum]